MRATAAVLLFLLTASASAQDFPDDYTRLLVPLTAYQVSGANGSVWTTEWTVFNDTDTSFYVGGPFPFIALSPMVQDNRVKGRETKRLILSEAVGGRDGGWIFLPTARLGSLSMSLRVRDISVNAQSYGTSIPLVADSEHKPSIRIVDVPTDAAYRATLRVYSQSDVSHPVVVRVFAPDHMTPVEEYEIPLHEHDDQRIERAPRPAYAQLDPLTAAVRAAGPRVRIEVTSKGAAVWAFVSITHDVTQQVTTVLP